MTEEKSEKEVLNEIIMYCIQISNNLSKAQQAHLLNGNQVEANKLCSWIELNNSQLQAYLELRNSKFGKE